MVLQVVPTHHGALLINSWLIFLKFCAVITGNMRRYLQLVQVAQVVRLLPIVCRASQHSFQSVEGVLHNVAQCTCCHFNLSQNKWNSGLRFLTAEIDAPWIWLTD